jgi:DNA polymerase-3 subunit alpha
LITAERRANGPFESFKDFVERIDLSVLNKRTIESLVKAGAFDSLGLARKGLFARYDEILDGVIARRRAEDMGQYSLFGSDEPAVSNGDIEIEQVEWDKMIKLGFEKEMLGLYVSDHPLFGIESALRAMAPVAISGLPEQDDRATVTIAGVVGSVNRRYTKGGEPILWAQVEDLAASVEVVCFPKVVHEFGPLIREDAILVVRGYVDRGMDDVKVIAQQIREPNLEAGQAVRLRVPAPTMSAELVGSLRAVLTQHPGSVPVFLHLAGSGQDTVVRLGQELLVEPRTALYAELRELLGTDAVMG